MTSSREGAAKVAIVLGLVCLILSPIPILNNAGIIAGIIAVPTAIYAAFGIKRSTAIIAGGIAVLGLVISLSLQAHWSHQLDHIKTESNSGVNE